MRDRRSGFRHLHVRLVAHIQALVRNGELSERGMARITGVSQPHIHNVLKGVRLLSMDMADQILRRLRIDLMDLAIEGDSDWAPSPGAAAAVDYRRVGLLQGWIGPGRDFPDTFSDERYPFQAALVELLDSPAAVRLAPDPSRPLIFSAAGVVLLERSEKVRREPDEDGYFALALPSGGTIGLVRSIHRRLCLWACNTGKWQASPLPQRDRLQIIQGRVSVVVRSC